MAYVVTTRGIKSILVEYFMINRSRYELDQLGHIPHCFGLYALLYRAP